MSMSSTACVLDFVITKEHRRFAEFCDACRRYGYIGLCYGPPGVGKTLSARRYANWNQVEAYSPYSFASDAELAALLGSHTVFYTPKVVNSPKQIEQDIQGWRNRLRAIPLEAIRREEEGPLEFARRQDEASKHAFFLQTIDTLYAPPSERPEKTESMVEHVVKTYAQKRAETPEPTTLLMIDETDRLKTAGLEQVRDIFDQGGIGVVLIGMPGLEKRLSRYPQLYSRVGFVHAFRPLSAEGVRDLFQHNWLPSGIVLPDGGLNDEAIVATIIRITGGNFRLLHRLLTQMARLVEINALPQVTREVVEAARESLVIGIV
jgi:DNA transposition AAA+ family ATPase